MADGAGEDGLSGAEKILGEIDGLTSDLDALDLVIKRTIERAIEKDIRRRVAFDRTILVFVIAGTYAIALVILFSFVIWRYPIVNCPASENCTDDLVLWKEQASFLLDAIASTILPVLTLVLGFYFGTQKEEQK